MADSLKLAMAFNVVCNSAFPVAWSATHPARLAVQSLMPNGASHNGAIECRQSRNAMIVMKRN
ncbi:MAG TPA: hypothetical protein VF573_02780 [Paraburkholderia sp.]|uniref:hypothetical protein n=1 Tax=Paraburkholderia sp. TaxID=1926495 RepID=UPI002ED59DA4